MISMVAWWMTVLIPGLRPEDAGVMVGRIADAASGRAVAHPSVHAVRAEVTLAPRGRALEPGRLFNGFAHRPAGVRALDSCQLLFGR